MPQLDVTKTGGKIRATPPAQIPYPDYVAGQAYRGQQELGAALARLSAGFIKEILESNINKEITETWNTIEKQHYAYFQKEEADPEKYMSEYGELINGWHELVDQQKTKSAKAVLSKRLADTVWGWQSQIIDKGRMQLRKNAIDSYAIVKEDKKSLFAVPQFISPTGKMETLLEAVKRTVSSAELDIETAGQKIIDGAAIRSDGARQADIDEIKVSIVANSVYHAFPDKVEGYKWLKKNYKDLGLSVSEFNMIGNLLEDVWKKDDLILKFQLQQHMEQVSSQVWDAVTKSDFETAQLLVDASNLPVEGTGGKKFWTEYIEVKREKMLVGDDAIDIPTTVYEINEIIDDLWLGERSWQDLRFALAKGEVTNQLKSMTKNRLFEEAKTKFGEQQKREWAAIKVEAKAAIIIVPGPEDIGFAEFRSGQRPEDIEESEKKRQEQVFRFNEFRKDFIEWMNKNPEATFYEYQEKRLELLYGKYTTVEDELLKKRVEAALRFEVGEERLINDEVYIYLGGDKWKRKQ